MYVNAELDDNDKTILRQTFIPDAAKIIIQNDLISRVVDFLEAHYTVLEVLDVPDIKEVQ